MPPSWDMPPPPPKLLGTLMWVLGLPFLILYFKWGSDSKGVKIGSVGLYFSMCTSQQNMCALSNFSVLDMDLGTTYLVRDHVKK